MSEDKKVARAWYQMRYRCNNPKARNYAAYGGRGIGICPEWEDKETFIKDMGPRPTGSSLDRKNNDGDYSKENCRWATWKQQANNRRAFGKIKEEYISLRDSPKPYLLRVGSVSLGYYSSLGEAVKARDDMLGGYRGRLC